MRVLLTCDRYPRSLSEGLILRIYHYVKRLNARHTFDLVCLDDRSPRNAEMESLFRRVERFPVPERAQLTGLARTRHAFSVRSLYPYSAPAAHAIDRLVAAESYDLVWDAACAMLFNLENARARLPLLADQVDDVFLMLGRNLALARGAYRKLRIVQHMSLERTFARRYLANAEAVLFVSEVDAASFRRVCPDADIAVIPNGVDETYFTPMPSDASAPDIVFEGAMSFRPNIDAARAFVSDIFPLIRAQIPDARFTIVGRDPAPQVQALAGADVQVTGSVPDVRPYLSRAHVFVCPMRLGSGIKNKILQAWAMGKAVVSTPEGVAGLEHDDGGNIVIARSASDFASAVVALLRDPQRAARLGKAARATIEERYTWDAKTAELEALMQRVVEKRARPVH